MGRGGGMGGRVVNGNSINCGGSTTHVPGGLGWRSLTEKASEFGDALPPERNYN